MTRILKNQEHPGLHMGLYVDKETSEGAFIGLMVHEIRLKRYGADKETFARDLDIAVTDVDAIETGKVTPTILFMVRLAQATDTDVHTNLLGAMALNYPVIWNGSKIGYGKIMMKLASKLAVDLGEDIQHLNYERLADVMLEEAARQRGKKASDFSRTFSS